MWKLVLSCYGTAGPKKQRKVEKRGQVDSKYQHCHNIKSS